MNTIRDADVALGDTIMVLGHARTIVEIEPYQHPELPDWPCRMVRWPGHDGRLDAMTVCDEDSIELAARPRDERPR